MHITGMDLSHHPTPSSGDPPGSPFLSVPTYFPMPASSDQLCCVSHTCLPLHTHCLPRVTGPAWTIAVAIKWSEQQNFPLPLAL
jgi:hypothetical protein